MRNWAQEHFDRVTAARRGETGRPQTDPDSAHEAVLRRLAAHRDALKAIASVEAKAVYKREKALPDIRSWVEGALEANRGGEDPVLSYAMPWLFDVGEFWAGLMVGDYILRHGLALPDTYKRKPATAIGDMVADAALSALQSGAGFDRAVVLQALSITAAHDMPDEVRAKLHKAAGLLIMPETLPAGFDDPSAALEAHAHLQRALQLCPRVGVKKEFERLQKYAEAYQKHQAAQRAANTDNSESASGTGGANGQGDAPELPPGNPAGGEGSPPASP